MIDRRAFLARGAGALVTLGLPPPWRGRTAMAAAPRRTVLVSIFLRGGVDGLSMVVPFGEPGYYRLRPTIALAPPGREDAAIDLDGFFGFHPRLAPLLPWWRRGHLAVVHACGLPVAARSHFDAQDEMEAAMRLATPSSPVATAAYDRGPGSFPASPLGRALSSVAGQIRSGAAPACVRVECGGWDHHSGQGAATGLLARRLDDLARCLAAFATELDDALADVVVVTISEFGRSVVENSGHGTDHGHGNAVLLLGGPVRGGRVYGRWPGLGTGLTGSDLAMTTDVRDVIALTTT